MVHSLPFLSHCWLLHLLQGIFPRHWKRSWSEERREQISRKVALYLSRCPMQFLLQHHEQLYCQGALASTLFPLVIQNIGVLHLSSFLLALLVISNFFLGCLVFPMHHRGHPGMYRILDSASESSHLILRLLRLFEGLAIYKWGRANNILYLHMNAKQRPY